jgi:hypothetical protein
MNVIFLENWKNETWRAGADTLLYDMRMDFFLLRCSSHRSSNLTSSSVRTSLPYDGGAMPHSITLLKRHQHTVSDVNNELKVNTVLATYFQCEISLMWCERLDM